MEQEFEAKSFGHACDYVAAIERGKVAKTMALGFVQLVSPHLDDKEMTDAEFRQFMRDSMRGIPLFGYKENGET